MSAENISGITRKCMATDKPLVSIVLALYKPNMNWLAELLGSLNEQSYPNLELLICDDCPDDPVDEKIFSEIITDFPFRIFQNRENLGSNKAFEMLTTLAGGKYISYCDQDDIWYSDKIEKMAERLEKTGSPLVCSDMRIIDGSGVVIADSITKLRRRHVFYEGEGLAPALLVSNFVTGCAMMINADTAKKSVPFVDSLVHDQWLAINAAIEGKIEVIREPLLDYRQHKDNQTGVLKNIFDKQSYYYERLTKYLPRISDYKNRIYSGAMRGVIDDLETFYKARIGYSERISVRDLKTMLKFKKFAPRNVLVEAVMKFIPDIMFKKIISLAKNGKI